jgi:hypothetical protein
MILFRVSRSEFTGRDTTLGGDSIYLVLAAKNAMTRPMQRACAL